MLKHTIMLLVLTAVYTLGAGSYLAESCRSKYCIVLPDQPTAVEKTAAAELKKNVAAVTGAELPVIHESERPAQRPALVLGNTALARKVLGRDLQKYPLDTIVLKSSGSDLILTGHPKRGTLYAVYEFIEKDLGVRFWTSTESHIPQRPTLEISDWDLVYSPVFIHRDTFYVDLHRNPAFASKMRVQGIFNPIPAEYGGHELIIGKAHTFKRYIPARAYFKKYPE